MACLKSLLTDFLSGADAGGVWTYTGPQPITVTITGLGPTVLNPGDVIDPGNDDPELDFETITGLACGSTYPNAFTYTVTSGNCEDTAVVPLDIECPPDAGGPDIELDFCESDSPIVLFDQIGGSPDTTGVWSGTGTANPGYDAQGAGPEDDTFDPGASGVVSGLVFTYTVSSTATDCPCLDSVVNITINVAATPEAGTPATASICI